MNNKLKIAIVAPPFGENGGPEVVSKNLAEALQKEGVEVTLFAPGDWHTTVKHVATLEKSIWNMSSIEKRGKIEQLRIDSQMKVIEYADEFDLIHFNCQRYAPFAVKHINKPYVVTLHNNYSKEKTEELRKLGLYTVAVSHAQNKKAFADAVIGNGLPVSQISASFEKGKYLIFLGRLTDQKGVDTAIKIALKSGEKLYIFGRIGNTKERKEYFKEKIKPFIDDKQIFYFGNVSHEEIYQYCSQAKALLFPIRRAESFGLVVIEALSCGTPIIGTCTDPLTEILKDRKVSLLSDNFDELVVAAKNTEIFDRRACRKYAKENFDSIVMAKKYLNLYEKIVTANFDKKI